MDRVPVLDAFHPVIKKWFVDHIGAPNMPQVLGWPEIQAGNNVLISAPTGAGKTLAAFLESIDHLLKKGLEGALPPGVFILYVSPLKALNNDIHKNLDIPLDGIKKGCIDAGIPFPGITKAVRTGDTPQNERRKMLKHPPHILITTPESLYLMLTSRKAMDILRNVRYLIVDEIHTMLGTKRGVHLAVSIERLQHLTEHEIVRIGLSATVNPVEAAARYLGGLRKIGHAFEERPVSIVAPAMERNKDLKIHMPVPDYRVLESGTIWPEIYDSILKLVRQHVSTIVFVNNRAVAERIAANVNSLAGEEICRPHHGSMSKSRRLEVEDGFKRGDITCVVATSTLELGIDIGSVDLMIQVASPVSISSGLQRLGRAGHRLDATSKGRIIPKTRGDLVKSAFISREMLSGRIERERPPVNCLDILAQHVVSMCCERKWDEDELLAVIRCASSYRDLRDTDFRRVLAMLSGEFEHLEDIPAKPRVQWDRQNRTVEGTAYSRILAISSSGTIPDRGYYSVVLEDHKTRIGELDEVFVFEARLGDRFMLGNSAWKIQRIEKDRVIVTPTSSVGAKTPFWQGDGIGCPFEQGIAYGRLLGELSKRLETDDFVPFLTSTTALDETAALNVRNYLMDQKEATGCLSNDRCVVVEYLSDDVSDQRIIVHAHFGGRVNSVLTILLQKTLEETLHCQVFASHSNDAILVHVYGYPERLTNVLSLLDPANVEKTLLDMLPTTSRFAMAFRYNAYRALMMGVRNLGERLPLWIQRLRSVDTLENAMKHLDHPLVIETMRECLEEIFDLPNTAGVLRDIRAGKIEVVEKNTWFPSPFASELLFEFKGVMVYEEKAPHPGASKQPAISSLNAINLSYHLEETGVPVDAEAVQEVSMRNSALSRLPGISSPNELHSFLLIYGDMASEEVTPGRIQEWLAELLEQKRVLARERPGRQLTLYIAAEEADLYRSAETDLSCTPEEPGSPGHGGDTWTQDEAVARIVRRYARYHSPFTPDDLTSRYGYDPKKALQVLHNYMSEGLIKTGHFTDADTDEFCHTRVYDAIVRKTSSIRASEVVAKEPQAYASFLQSWQKVGAVTTPNPEVLLHQVIRQLEGLYLPSSWWEDIVFPARIKGYSPAHLDRLCSQGKVFWRVAPSTAGKDLSLAWFCMESLAPGTEADIPETTLELGLELGEERAFHALQQKGACFTHVLAALTGMKSSELLDVLEQLIRKGLVVNDSFMPVRFLMNRSAPKTAVQRARRVASFVSRMEMGRWEIAWPVPENDLQQLINRWLGRYGLLCRESFSMEPGSVSWNEVYECLKLREYAGKVVRGYFIQGISGIQFMLPEAYQRLGSPAGMQVINACDPAQAFGKVLSHSASALPFANLPGTVIVTDSGMPSVVFERYGERVTFAGSSAQVTQAIQLFKAAFVEKRVWPDQRRVVVKYWPEDAGERETLQAALAAAGFENVVQDMVLRR